MVKFMAIQICVIITTVIDVCHIVQGFEMFAYLLKPMDTARDQKAGDDNLY